MSEPITVLQSLPAERPTTNPYLLLLGRGLRGSGEVELRNFSFPTALLGRYDLFHVHWPENLVSAASGPKRLARRLLTAAFLARLTLTRRPVVRTLHNLHRPDGLGRVDRLLLGWFDRLTRVWIVLSEHTPRPATGTSVLIPHGHYRDWYAGHPRSAAQPGRIGYAGLVRRYKGVETLIAAFRGRPADEGLSLLVAGRPSSGELADTLTDLAAGDARITLDLRYLPDADLVAAIDSAELVALPYRFMHNSGGALAALSLDRPILVPANEVNAALSAEVGPGWVHQFDGELTTETLVAAAHAARDRPAGRPDLSGREWEGSVRAHIDAYRTALRPSDRRSAPRVP